ncbi:hypothetical protein Zmor_026048 [Zophobas morio]|uniref:Uncharacterized protein n=1 Tax=Zophobas morio TaxID=2755281 RepID=A0AA38M536_9CUCU|nr:hypothetical protein Zmor_026048 [Zophobas morio]
MRKRQQLNTLFVSVSALASYKKSILGDIWPSMAKIREFLPPALFKYIQEVTSRGDPDMHRRRHNGPKGDDQSVGW